MPLDKALFARLEPLITAAEMFPALERLCLAAREEVLLSFRIFDPLTPLRSEQAAEQGLKTWGELLASVAERGVKVRLLIADFDPLFASELHRDAWANARGFANAMGEQAEIICAQHSSNASPFWRYVFAPKIRQLQKGLKRYSGDQITPQQHQALAGKLVIRPVSLHQKFAVADGIDTVIGGIDINQRRWDDPDHEQRAEETWHDVSLAYSGPVAGDIRLHFADCWDRARVRGGTSFGAEPTPVAKTRALPDPNRSSRGPRLLRTLSVNKATPLALGPRRMITEHEEAHLAAFETANRLVYIETQFFRHMPLARALADRAAKAPDLNVVLVVPTEPERVIFDGHDGVDVRHAQNLQLRCLTRLRQAFGDRLAIVAPAQPRAAPRHTPMPLHGAPIIYLHSKVTLVDNSLGIVGSANLNGRSMHWDTEASLQFHDPAFIKMLRERLMGHWLRDTYDAKQVANASFWTRAAADQAALEPDARSAYVLPWPERRNRRFARPFPILPADMF